jgi:hypothetical protein
MSDAPGAFTIHGHFYQPPRENPWTEVVARELTAEPFHDWNQRITAESYRPNAFAQVVDERGAVRAVLNNFELMSFDLGPTLAVWLADNAPDVLARVRAADATAHTAIAHPFHHSILPLATERDARTEIRWGIADFRHRFGRQPEGFWLPETAVSDTVLRILVEEGIAFTVLAPSQVTTPGSSAPIPGVPGRWRHLDGRTIDLVVYDGDLSHRLAFDMSALPAERLVQLGQGRGPLVVAATDGETFGHHHHFTERAVAYAFGVLGANTAHGSLSRLLSAAPERQDLLVFPSAWSCAHGLGRWMRDCGCSTGGEPGWNQAWRAPLRRALEHLRDHAHRVFEHRGGRVLTDPWAARDAYIQVYLGIRDRQDFADEYVRGDLVEALTLLEMERHSLAMFTSCAWFFNDLAGLETVQILRYAARCLDLIAEAGDEPPTMSFVDILSEARSNEAVHGDGRRIFSEQVDPVRITANRAAAHAVVEAHLRRRPVDRVGAFDIGLVVAQRAAGDLATVEIGEVTVTHRRTGAREAWPFVVVGGTEGEVFGVLDGQVDNASVIALAHGGASMSDLRTALANRATYFGLDALIVELAVDLAGRFGSTALVQLVDRALHGDGEAVVDALRLLEAFDQASVRLDLAPAQEGYWRFALGRQLDGAVVELGRRLGLDPERLLPLA